MLPGTFPLPEIFSHPFDFNELKTRYDGMRIFATSHPPHIALIFAFRRLRGWVA
jgi:hypothetical protein